MTELSKTEQAIQSLDDSGMTSPTLETNKVCVHRKQNEAFAVQFTPEVLCPTVEGKTVKAMRQEANIDYNTGHAVLHLRNGQDLKINCNDWLIMHSNGSYEVVKEADFAANWDIKDFLNSGSAAPNAPIKDNPVIVEGLGSGIAARGKSGAIPPKPSKPTVEEILAKAKADKLAGKVN